MITINSNSKMSCVLCVASSIDPGASVEINSTEGRKLNILCTITRYFSWLKIDLIDNANCCVCRKCWQALFTFHQFYVQVENAHKLLQCGLKLARCCTLPEQLLYVEAANMENEYDADQNRQIILEQETIFIPAVKSKLKLVQKCCREARSSKKRADSENKQGPKIEEVYLPYVKGQNFDMAEANDAFGKLTANEVLQAEEQPTEQIGADDDFELISMPDDPAILKKLSKRQRVYSKKKLTSRERDEYIASHFKLNCNICSVALENFKTLQTHFRTEHKSRGFVLCCGKKLLKRELLVDHLHLHQNPAYFSCPRCGKELASRRCLDHHLQRHDQPNENKYECEICERKFSLRTSYTRHLLIHLPEEKKTLSCPECGKSFATQYVMNQHFRLVHLNSYAKICDVCGKSLASPEALRLHLEEHSDVQRPVIQCKLCGVKLTSKYGLNRHMKSIHVEENRQPRVCPICSKVSAGIRAHKTHMDYVHNRERNHVCSICSKAFKRPLYLKQHMATHTGEVVYKCPHCPKTFNFNSNMHSHRKKMHRQEWEEMRLQRFKEEPPKFRH